LPLGSKAILVELKTGSSISCLPRDGSKHKSLVTAKKSDPVSKSTVAGVLSEPIKIWPLYPAPSSFVTSTLIPSDANTFLFSIISSTISASVFYFWLSYTF